jgi:hypothetical protein
VGSSHGGEARSSAATTRVRVCRQPKPKRVEMGERDDHILLQPWLHFGSQQDSPPERIGGVAGLESRQACCSSRCQSTGLRWPGCTQAHKNHREDATVYPGSGQLVPYV